MAMHTIINKDGERVNVNNGGAKGLQERMLRNGWRLESYKHPNESAQELYDRLIETGMYSQVKVYWVSNMIPGLHSFFAMVKW